MLRYMAFIWDADNVERRSIANTLAKRLMESSSGWQSVADSRGLRVLCAGAGGGTHSRVLHGHAGAVVGTIFERSVDAESTTASEAASFDADETARIVADGGRCILTKYWGRYVAFLVSPDGAKKWVIKDPTENLPSFMTEFSGVTVCFSSLADCVRLGILRVEVNWQYMTHRVAFGFGPAGHTAITGVSEIYGGERIEIRANEVSRSFLWNPAAVANSDVIEDPVQAASALRTCLKSCTHTWTRNHSAILHSLSGGLDSSIVLSSLADSPYKPKVTCATYYMPGGNSDERPYARLAAAQYRCDYIERPRKLAATQFRDLLRLIPLVNPLSGGYYCLEFEAVEHQLAQELGIDGHCSGNPGDTVLGSMSRFYSVTDFIRRHGLRWGALKVASDLAAHSKVSLWRILRASIRNGMSHSGFDMTAELLRDPTLLTESALAGVNKPRAFHPHPWFPLIDEMLPGTAQMVVGLTIRPDYYHPLTDAAESRPERLFPLLSQPFVELCLRIPSYVLNHGGRDRALARRAFVGDVPETILKRYWKDRAAGQEHVVLAANLEFFRELLLDGVLVKERLIDKGKLEEALSGRPTKSPVPIVKIFDAALVETWLRTKPGVLQRLAA